MSLAEFGELLKTDPPFDEAAFHRRLRKRVADWSSAKARRPADPKGDSTKWAVELYKKYARDLAAE